MSSALFEPKNLRFSHAYMKSCSYNRPLIDSCPLQAEVCLSNWAIVSFTRKRIVYLQGRLTVLYSWYFHYEDVHESVVIVCDKQDTLAESVIFHRNLEDPLILII
jgi:hypothetical protein